MLRLQDMNNYQLQKYHLPAGSNAKGVINEKFLGKSEK